MVTSDSYVRSDAWLRPTGRPDLIDAVADQFERPAVEQPSASARAEVRWPRASRGWRSHDRLHPGVSSPAR